MGVRGHLTDLRAGRHFFTTSLLQESQRLDVTIVGAVAGAQAAGLFAAPARLTGFLGIPATVVGNVLLTQLSGPQAPVRAAKRSIMTVVGGYVVLALVLAATAGPLATLVLGEEYRESGQLLVVYGIAMIPSALNSMCGAILAARSLERRIARTVMVTVPLSLVLVASGAALEGPLLATVGFLASQVMLALLCAPVAFRELRRMGDPRDVGAVKDASSGLTA
jgi:O-antigen/teichoic acid export membrane protein